MDTHTKVEETKDIESLYVESLQKIERGVITQGNVIAVKSEGVVVDIGYKSEGFVPISEFTEKEFTDIKEGDILEVLIEKLDEQGGVILSKTKASKIRARERLTDIYNSGSVIEGTVIEKTKGGLFVDIFGIKAFLPASQVDLKLVRNLDSFIGQTIPLKILKISQVKGIGNSLNTQSWESSIIVSRRQAIEEERLKKKEETFKILQEGALISGTVKNITDYGVFVDIGGIDGLLHISDISWRKVNHPSEFFSIGEQKEFVILNHLLLRAIL